MLLSQYAIRPRRVVLGPVPLRRLLLALVLIAVAALLGGASAARHLAAPLSASDLAAVYGGGCSSQCDDENDEDDEDDDPIRTGFPYWVESRRTLNSQDSSRESLEDMVINRSSTPLDTEFSYRHRTVRKIEFDGGWGSAFSAKVGGEIDVTRTRTLRKTLRPYEVGKIYTRFLTSRYTVYGKYYQDYTDGSRKVIDSDSGRYVTGNTVTGYVTYVLN